VALISHFGALDFDRDKAEQQKALEFLFFDLSGCVSSNSAPPPAPPPSAP
jgi:hypothetical protein